jgi:hypothetical protein
MRAEALGYFFGLVLPPSLMHWFYLAYHWISRANQYSIIAQLFVDQREHMNHLELSMGVGIALLLLTACSATPDLNLLRAKRAATELIGAHIYNFCFLGALVALAGWSAHEQSLSYSLGARLQKWVGFGRPKPRLSVAEFQLKWFMGTAYSLLLASKLEMWEQPPRRQRL